MRNSPPSLCLGGCGARLRGGRNRWCAACWHRLPQPLRREYLAVCGGGITSGVGRTPSQVRHAIEEWLTANPQPPPAQRPPLWKTNGKELT